MTPCPDCGKPLYPDSIHTCSPQMTTIDNIMALVADSMTLRDYFAAKAMPVHMAALSNWAAGSPEAWQAEISRLSYATADAMLKAREA